MVCPSADAHLLGDGARDHVRGAAGRERHDHGDGTFGVVLRGSGGDASDSAAMAATRLQQPSHFANAIHAALLQMRHQAREQAAAVGAAHDVFDMVFRMRHHAEHIAALVDDAGDRFRRAVDVGVLVDHAVGGAIAIEHPPLALEPLQGLFVGLVIALAMRDRHADDLTGIVAAGERRIGTFDPQMHVMADEFQPRVAHQHAGQQAGLAEDLKSVADAEHEAAIGRERPHRVHDRRARGNGAAAQIIAVGKSAGHHHEIGALGQRGLGMPDHRGFMPGRELQRARHVALAIDAGKDEDGGFHRASA